LNHSIVQALIRRSLDHPRSVVGLMLGFTFIVAVLAALPNFWAPAAKFLPTIAVDTDPENMLAADEPVRLFHDEKKKQFNLYDMVVVGVVNDEHPDGVFNVETLQRVFELTRYARTLNGEAIGAEAGEGVVSVDLISPSTVDNVESEGLGTVRFEWLMSEPPSTPEQALAVRDKARRIPFLDGTLVSDRGAQAGKSLALYLPLTRKDLAHSVSLKLQERIAQFDSSEQFHITGLPVAEDTFGVEMFKQMAISAPIAMLVIFLLMWAFFRKLSLIIAPMVLAALTAMQTMGLLVVSGKTIHIMSSMIPIFIMPIAVLDAIHIISEFFDRYAHVRDRRETAKQVLEALFKPLLFTSLTTSAGFASLALTPIPPVQVFGVFVAVGVMLAWLWTITFIPASIMLIGESRLKSLATSPEAGHEFEARGPMRAVLHAMGRLTTRRAPWVLVTAAVLAAVSVYGISRIVINDNPTKWFEADHPIRVADRVLNRHFGGTYMAYLTLRPGSEDDASGAASQTLAESLRQRGQALQNQGVKHAQTVFEDLASRAEQLAAKHLDTSAWLEALKAYSNAKLSEATDDQYAAWDEAALEVERAAQRREIFKQPEALAYMEALQAYLTTIPDERGERLVGKSNSLADIVKTVHRELLGGGDEQYRVPDNARIVAETLIQYQNSHRPQDLDKMVTRNSAEPNVHFREANIWLQLHSGDNRDMQRVTAAVQDYMKKHPAPFGLVADWFGLTYINVVWQDKMVSGMLQAFLGSFLVVLLMMILLFRSALWGILSMIPLTLTVGMIYGLIGLIGKDYDMPVAVLSSLSLGLAVDYAIHFLARSRDAVAEHGSWAAAADHVFGEPARAIARNAIVVGVGFMPLLLAPLTPYKTVGLFIALILLTAGAASLFILPSLISVLQRWLFPRTRAATVTCNCGTCLISGIVLAGLVAVNLHQFLHADYTSMTWLSVAAIPVFAGACWFMSRRDRCKTSLTPTDPQGVAS
jgi:predicted RND superfamily exporter protein